MNETILTPILDLLDIVGIAVFALSGAVIAAREKQTFVTMGFFALVTGVGGGTVRDLLIDAPVFWITDPWVAAVCLGCALIAWFTPLTFWQGKLFDMADGAGLAAYAVLGSAKALAYGVPPIPAILMGIITGCVGGIIRDVVAGRPSIIMQPELYVTAAALSSAITVAGMTLLTWLSLSIPNGWIWAGAFIAGFALRAAAIQWELGLPSYRTKTIEPETSPPRALDSAKSEGD
ncbi:trimeric intracellular cation channel family protein [Erythrobacter sp. F6033]|uniref:trimeric intracellular cation channel family protein n=1 Tax=Erythrobacter sp. F6033 TaxID=2926401 RepID=UPI001FF53387|nr:trimeric intracellular cation channel family protein [Erythrobacter sp. F6033]MCK0128032.1 trimeric intracellular cation channel family protein [Erythrobacter sp. F6033]